MMVAYGYKISGVNDVFIEHARETSQITGQAMAPGRWLVESFPLRESPICTPQIKCRYSSVKYIIQFVSFQNGCLELDLSGRQGHGGNDLTSYQKSPMTGQRSKW